MHVLLHNTNDISFASVAKNMLPYINSRSSTKRETEAGGLGGGGPFSTGEVGFVVPSGKLLLSGLEKAKR